MSESIEVPGLARAIGRLALRQEGPYWNAYYAETGTMEDAFLIGSISMLVCDAHPERKQEFMDLMREVVGDLIETATGRRPVFKDPAPGPEHERAGNG